MIKIKFRLNLPDLLGIVGQLLALLLGALLCWRAATWTWYFVAPPPRPVIPELRSEVNVATVSRLTWFGAEPVVSATAPAVAMDLKLVGVFSGGRQPAALIAVGAQNPAAFGVGEDLTAGTKLTKVEADHVFVDRNGVIERINLLAPVLSIQHENPGKDTPRK